MKHLRTAFPLLIVPMLSACTSVSTTKDATQVLTLLGKSPATVSNAAKLNEAANSKPYGVQNLARQVLGTSGPSQNTVRNARGVNYSAEEKNPVPARLAHNSVVKKLVTSQVTGDDITVGAGEMKTFAKEFYTAMSDPYSTDEIKVLKNAKNNSEIAFGNILLGYFMAYQKGNFVRRDGTALGKPKISVSYTNGTIGGSIDNDTISGLLTVFADALFDYGLATPIFYQEKAADPTYNSKYIPTQADPNLYTLVYEKKDNPPQKDYLVGGKTPTAAAFLSTSKLADGYPKPAASPLTVTEYQFIRFSATQAADRSKNLSGIIIRTFGAVHAGQFIYGSFAIGNNETLSKIVETSLSCFSGNLTEHVLVEAFEKYDGKNDAVNLILDHYKDIYDKISKLEK